MDNTMISNCINHSKEWARRLLTLLKRKNINIITTESVTGGLIVKTLLDIPSFGAQVYGSYVAYSDQAKHELLQISTKNVYTPETAIKMSQNALMNTAANVSLAIVGHAGPIDMQQLGMFVVSVSVKVINSESAIMNMLCGRNDMTIKRCSKFDMVTFTETVKLGECEELGHIFKLYRDKVIDKPLDNESDNFIAFIRQILQLNMTISACKYACHTLQEEDDFIYCGRSNL